MLSKNRKWCHDLKKAYGENESVSSWHVCSLKTQIRLCRIFNGRSKETKTLTRLVDMLYGWPRVQCCFRLRKLRLWPGCVDMLYGWPRVQCCFRLRKLRLWPGCVDMLYGWPRVQCSFRLRRLWPGCVDMLYGWPRVQCSFRLRRLWPGCVDMQTAVIWIFAGHTCQLVPYPRH